MLIKLMYPKRIYFSFMIVVSSTMTSHAACVEICDLQTGVCRCIERKIVLNGVDLELKVKDSKLFVSSDSFNALIANKAINDTNNHEMKR